MGSDKTLRAPPITGDKSLSAEQQAKLNQESFEGWRTAVSEALGAAKSNCSSKAGEPSNQSILADYSEPFGACMSRHGWQRTSNPL